MEELNALLASAGVQGFEPSLDGNFHYIDEKAGHWFIGWSVSDDYGIAVWMEAKYCLAGKMGEWVPGAGAVYDGLAAPLKEKILAARSAHRTKMIDGIAGPGAGLAVVEERPLVEDEPDEDFIPAPENVRATWDALGLVLTEKKQPVPNADNSLRILEGLPAFSGRIWLDEFSNQIVTTFGGRGEEREWTDSDTRALWLQYQRRIGIARVGKDPVLEAVMAYAHKNRRHPVKEWLAGIEWDHTPRIDTFFRDLLGAEDTAFSRAASRNFFLGMVARVYSPGCKVDNMVVLEGAQGAKKSSALKALCGKWFTECNEPISQGNNKDFYAVLQGKMLVEIAELDSFSRADIRRIKAIITTAADRYRPAYGRIAQSFPRTSVFVGTTNEDEYLEDATGGRRFWPVRVGVVRLDEIETLRDQLFAEALQAYAGGATWWEVPAGEAQAEQEARRKRDPWEAAIAVWLDQPRMIPDVNSLDVASGALKLEPVAINQFTLMRVAYCMKAMGYRNAVKKAGGKTVRVWVK